MLGSRSSTRSLAFVALVTAGCSLGDFGYLSAEFGQAGAGDTALSGAAGAGRGGDGGTNGNATGGDALGGSAAQAGIAMAGSAATAGSTAGMGGNAPNQFFCDPKYAVFDAAAGGAPPADLPETGDYLLHREAPEQACLITPDWPELEDHVYWAVTHDCGAVDALEPATDDVWHLEHVCSDVYRFTSHHGTDAERVLGIKDQAEVGSPLYSVPHDPRAPSYDPSLLFHLRFEQLLGSAVRWRFSPVIQSSLCVEETGQAHYGQLDVTRVVLYPCTGSLSSQSWNLLPVP